MAGRELPSQVKEELIRAAGQADRMQARLSAESREGLKGKRNPIKWGRRQYLASVEKRFTARATQDEAAVARKIATFENMKASELADRIYDEAIAHATTMEDFDLAGTLMHDKELSVEDAYKQHGNKYSNRLLLARIVEEVALTATDETNTPRNLTVEDYRRGSDAIDELKGVERVLDLGEPEIRVRGDFESVRGRADISLLDHIGIRGWRRKQTISYTKPEWGVNITFHYRKERFSSSGDMESVRIPPEVDIVIEKIPPTTTTP